MYHCINRATGAEVAVKVVRGIKKYTESAQIECRILTAVNMADPRNESHCVRFYDTFMHDGHLCMVFELLGPSVFDYLKKNKYRPLPLYVVQSFADQLMWSIAFLHSMDLTHTDLKPENMLICNTTFGESNARTASRERKPVLAPRTTEMRGASWWRELWRVCCVQHG